MSHATYRWFTLKDAQNEDDAKHIAIHEVWEEGIHGKVWDSALVMVHVIQTMARDNHFLPYIQGKHVVDLSAGTGLLGLCALHQGRPEKVTVTELDEAVPLIKSNVALNLGRYASRIQVMALSWGDKAAAAACGPADLILASDVLYESEFFEVLVQSLADLCSEKGRIYIGYKRRGLSIDDETRFWTLCEQHFAVTLLNDHPDDPDHRLVPELASQVGVKLYRLLRP
ncbi:putative methyltransferase-domain-containing protein [Gongronella butleri]|nr:putative methyltransferase-domain-containing protein [Gongronella butleri]